MCVIIAKFKDGRLPTKEELKNCFDKNSNGAGFMYYDNAKDNIIIDKGYMNYNEFINRFDELCEHNNNFKDKALVIHCRITTDGSTSAKNCHPFSLCGSIEKMHSLKQYTRIGVAHNGIITNYAPPKDNIKDISDTMNFILSYLWPTTKNAPHLIHNKAFKEGISLIAKSKFAIMEKEFIELVGDFIELEKGLYFSNDSYKKYTYVYYNNYNYKDYYYDDYYDYGYYGQDIDKIDYNNDSFVKLSPEFYGRFTELTDEGELVEMDVQLNELKTSNDSEFYYDIKYNELFEYDTKKKIELEYYTDVVILDGNKNIIYEDRNNIEKE